MGFYSRFIFPQLCDWALDQRAIREQRQQLLASVHGDVLEIGFGTGLNLPWYPQHVEKISVVDPNIGMNRRARRRIQATKKEVQVFPLRCEAMPIADASFDFVVSTFTMCSVENVDAAMSEVFRVLKPGGQFRFFEHGLSPDADVQRWQWRLNRLQQWLGDGCQLIRDIKQIVAAQNYGSISCEQMYFDGMPKTHGYMYRGCAIKP